MRRNSCRACKVNKVWKAYIDEIWQAACKQPHLCLSPGAIVAGSLFLIESAGFVTADETDMLRDVENHLDLQMIDALAVAINNFSGGLVLVSHDFRLIGQVAKEIWVCDKKKITPWSGDIQSYKTHLKKQVMKKFKA